MGMLTVGVKHVDLEGFDLTRIDAFMKSFKPHSSSAGTI